MNLQFRLAIFGFIANTGGAKQIVKSLDYDGTTGEGTITYNPEGLTIDPAAPGFRGTTTRITDEELVRAYLAVRLTTQYGYPARPEKIEFERVYKSVGRPGKGGRADLIVRNRSDNAAFLFVECKEPEQYDADMSLIDGQLFRLSRQERQRPANLLYFTVELRDGNLRERAILIRTDTYSDFDIWDTAGQPIIDAIPVNYGIAKKRAYANVTTESRDHRPLSYSTTADEFARIRNEIHDVIWGGGGTNNNDVFIYIVKLILCKIYDELETAPGAEYRFQRYGDADSPEESDAVAERMNELYKVAESAYLALPKNSVGPAFDHTRISNRKIAYVVGRLEALSVTRNTHNGDLLGEFFEQIVSQDFTQSKGQFFTPPKIVRFMLRLINAGDAALTTLKTKKDELGRPCLPYVIDPACGSGTFLIEYMKEITSALGDKKIQPTLSGRAREWHATWFEGENRNRWAREFLFGIENNYDLGLAAKVNMVLHGDGSMNTWINSALLPFNQYLVDRRVSLLSASSLAADTTGYPLPVNEQFDLIISNPPFSLTMAADEKRLVESAFGNSLKISEQLFIERWFQLLRPNGEFCCVLPESILDTSSNRATRAFMLKHFKLKAIVSLPYDAFKPFTSTKTCIVYAAKREHAALARWNEAWATCSQNTPNEHEALHCTLDKLGYLDEAIFMAEPKEVGYKRRKNLSDLPRPNQLYQETKEGFVAGIDARDAKTVLDYFFSNDLSRSSAELGFWITLRDVVGRPAFRFDPKYAWLWHKQIGLVYGGAQRARPLSDFLDIVELSKQKKGSLSKDTLLIDLDQVVR